MYIFAQAPHGFDPLAPLKLNVIFKAFSSATTLRFTAKKRVLPASVSIATPTSWKFSCVLKKTRISSLKHRERPPTTLLLTVVRNTA